MPTATEMVSFSGHSTFRRSATCTRFLSSPRSSGLHEASERPPNPLTYLSPEQLQAKINTLLHWFRGKQSILTLTGAGLSTESGIPDYRGHSGSYHNGHKPMIHDQFMTSAAQRRRYWGRGMVGWRGFQDSQPNEGHYALTQLEHLHHVGVTFDDSMHYYPQHEMMEDFSKNTVTGQQRMSIITQNVDTLHRKAGTRHVTELHGRTDRLKCMNCGLHRCRLDFHDALEDLNTEWLRHVLQDSQDGSNAPRPDGDAYIGQESYLYDDVVVPACQICGGFFKPDVVFFGDNVPKHRVQRCYAAVKAADGLLCVGSSLAVHSAYRFVKAASSMGIPIAVLNVGETRAETEGLDLLKVEAPAGPTLSGCVDHFLQQSEAKFPDRFVPGARL